MRLSHENCIPLHSLQSLSKPWKAIGGIPVHNCLFSEQRTPAVKQIVKTAAYLHHSYLTQEMDPTENAWQGDATTPPERIAMKWKCAQRIQSLKLP